MYSTFYELEVEVELEVAGFTHGMHTVEGLLINPGTNNKKALRYQRVISSHLIPSLENQIFFLHLNKPQGDVSDETSGEYVQHQDASA